MNELRSTRFQGDRGNRSSFVKTICIDWLRGRAWGAKTGIKLFEKRQHFKHLLVIMK